MVENPNGVSQIISKPLGGRRVNIFWKKLAGGSPILGLLHFLKQVS
jgi:hypothetical protein